MLAALCLAGLGGGCTNDNIPPLPSPLTGDANSAEWFSDNRPIETTEAFSVKHRLAVEWELAGCPAGTTGHFTIKIVSDRDKDASHFRTIVNDVGEGHGQVVAGRVSKQVVALQMVNPSLCTWRVRAWPQK